MASPDSVIATHISAATYMADYAAAHCEWVDGKVIRHMSPVSLDQTLITRYLMRLLETYLAFRPIGLVLDAPFVMVLPNSRREPDIQLILHTNPHALTDTYLDGAADLCIEVVAAESQDRDFNVKMKEYEEGGVAEYWIIDPLSKRAFFYRLNDDSEYVMHLVDHEQNYRTPLLPDFVLHEPTLWSTPLPDPLQVADMIRTMLSDE